MLTMVRVDNLDDVDDIDNVDTVGNVGSVDNVGTVMRQSEAIRDNRWQNLENILKRVLRDDSTSKNTINT